MKKHLSLLLAAVMALSLCVTALAESAVETTTVRLTGDAADQVANLKDGQRVRENRDVPVRLNVQSDPGAREYAVTLDGKPVEVDHSTSRYHFYYLSRELLAADAVTLNVSDLNGAVSIATADDLKSFRDRVNNGETALNAVLTADIDLQNESWTPIGTSSAMYTGTFDGDGHTVSGLNVTGANNGLFRMTGDAAIQNLTISDSTVATGGDFQNYGGAFVGLVKGNTSLINCHTTDTVTVSGGIVGGLLGGTNSSGASAVLTLERCSNAATVNGNATSLQGGVGGLIGHLRNGATITNSCNTGAVTNKSTSDSAPVGGLIGCVYSSSRYKNPLKLTNVYNTGTVTAGGSGTDFAGGLVGNSDWGFDITNAYGTMTVKIGNSYGGIIVGTVKNDVTVSNIYSELIRGKNTDCHVFLNDSIDKMAPVENNKMFNDTEMKAADKLLAKLGDGFAQDTDKINNGYPVLAWQNAAPAAAASLTVSVGSTDKTVTLPADGSTDAAAPTEVTVELDNPGEAAVMDRVYFKDLSDGITLGTGLNSKDGTLTGVLTRLDAGYTGDTLYFYKTPAATSLSVRAVWADGAGAKHYYTVKLVRAARQGYALEFMQSGMMNESAPVGINTYIAGSEYTSGMYAPYAYFALYRDGKSVQMGIQPKFPTDKDGLYYLDGVSIYAARPGRYWVPVSVEKDGDAYTGTAPLLVTWTLDALNGHLEEAKAVQAADGYASLPENLRTRFDAVVTRLTDAAAGLSTSVMLAADGTIATGDAVATDIQARDLGGKQIFGERLLEGDECALLDLMAIIKIYRSDKTLGAYQLQAYEKIAALGLDSFTDVTTLAQKASYTAYKQAKWDLLQATDLAGINAVLTTLSLETIIPEPTVLPGDINGDGQITLKDATLLLQYVNEVTTLTEQELAAADINGDGQITLKDATLLLQYVNEIISELPSNKS